MPIVRRHTLLVKTERGFFMSNSLNGRKVAVIGCGFVGSTTAYSLMQSKLFTDMVLIDVTPTEPKAKRSTSATAFLTTVP